MHRAFRSVHRGARVDVLADRAFQETGRGDDRHVRPVGQDAVHAAEVIAVRVGVDDRRHRAVAAVLSVQAECRGRAFDRDQRVDDDHAGVALDERDVREVEAANLVDPVGDLEQALLTAELTLPPQTRVNRFWAIAVKEAVGVGVPHHPAVGRRHRTGRQRCDEVAAGVLEVLPVRERRKIAHLIPP
jgi:hypothetical protein